MTPYTQILDLVKEAAINSKLPDDFAEAVRIAQAEFDKPLTTGASKRPG